MVKGYIEGQSGNRGGRIAVSRKHYVYCDMFYLHLLSVLKIASGLLIVLKLLIFGLNMNVCVCEEWGRGRNIDKWYNIRHRSASRKTHNAQTNSKAEHTQTTKQTDGW